MIIKFMIMQRRRGLKMHKFTHIIFLSAMYFDSVAIATTNRFVAFGFQTFICLDLTMM